jgi:hypothetical protein
MQRSTNHAAHFRAAASSGNLHWNSDRNRPIFEELQFMRLSTDWIESQRDAGLWGGAQFDHKIFRQFQLAWSPSVTLDFWFRGFRISPQSGRAFTQILRHAHPLTTEELQQIQEVLGVIHLPVKSAAIDKQPAHILLSAEVGYLKNKTVLAVNSEHIKFNRRYISLLIDATGDGRTIHEIHFSSPAQAFDSNAGVAHDAFRSIQWNIVTPPPMSSIAEVAESADAA